MTPSSTSPSYQTHLFQPSDFSLPLALLVSALSLNFLLNIFLISVHLHLLLISLAILITHSWCNLIPSFPPFSLCLPHYLSILRNTPSLRLFHVLTRSLSFPGRRWRDRTQGTSWWTSEWSHVLPFDYLYWEMVGWCWEGPPSSFHPVSEQSNDLISRGVMH